MALINNFAVISVVIVLYCGHRSTCKPLVLSVYAGALLGQLAGEYYIHVLIFSLVWPLLWLARKSSAKLSIRDFFLTPVDNVSRLTLYDLIVAYCGFGLIFLSPIFTFVVINIIYEILLIGSFYYVIFYSRQTLIQDIWELLATTQIVKIVMMEMQISQFTIFSCALMAFVVLVFIKLFKTIKTTM